MKTKFISLIFLIIFTSSCGGNDGGIDPGNPVVEVPKNLQVTTEISGASVEIPEGDGSGEVTYKATADNTLSFRLEYDGSSKPMPNGEIAVTFDIPGVHQYEVKITALGKENTSISKNLTTEVNREYEIPADLLTFLTNNDTQKWRIKSEAAGHFGVGPLDGSSPEYWAAHAFEKDYTSMYNSEYTFGVANLFEHKTDGAVYGKKVPLVEDLGTTTEVPNADEEYENYPLEDYAGTWQYAPIYGKETIYLSDLGFLGFYIGGTHAYTIIARTDAEMVVRTEGFDGNGWFFILTTEEEAIIPADPDYKNLVWMDDFEKDGAPDADKWTYDIGTGSNGWGNNEAQYYTDRASNVVVENGVLKIMAKKENYMGASYTSTRLKTQGKYTFTYGRVDIKAKLPSGGGTWPALWMLGSNITSVGWPACGEIDIMEYVGNNPGHIQSAIHNTSSSGNTINRKKVDIENENDEYHVYSMIWSDDQISFLLDGVRYYTYRPLIKNGANWPFSADQFLIMNIAIGGNLGGNIDPSYMGSDMIIDYVKVYQ